MAERCPLVRLRDPLYPEGNVVFIALYELEEHVRLLAVRAEGVQPCTHLLVEALVQEGSLLFAILDAVQRLHQPLPLCLEVDALLLCLLVLLVLLRVLLCLLLLVPLVCLFLLIFFLKLQRLLLLHTHRPKLKKVDEDTIMPMRVLKDPLHQVEVIEPSCLWSAGS